MKIMIQMLIMIAHGGLVMSVTQLLVNIGADNGLSPNQHQTITLNNADLSKKKNPSKYKHFH